MSLLKTALVAGVALAALTAQASAQFTERTIRVSNGVNAGPSGRQRPRQDEPMRRREVRRQDEAAGLLGRRARRRPPGHAGPALRHPGDGDHLLVAARRHPARSRRLRPALPVRQREGGRRRARRPVRQVHRRQAAGGRPRQPRLLGERLPQPHQLAQAGPEGGGLLRREGPGDAEQHLPRHLQDGRRQRRADGVRRGLHGARDQGDRRTGEPLRDHRHLEVLRGPEIPVDHATTPTRRSWSSTRSSSGTSSPRTSRRPCRIAPPSAATSSARSRASCRRSRSRTSRRPACRSTSCRPPSRPGCARR